MKKILITALALFIANSASAQDVRIGIKAGGNLSTVTSAPVGTKMKLGFHVGGFLDFKFYERFGLQPELLYSMQGHKYAEIGEEWNISINTTFDYINVPVLLKINIAEGFSAEIGPQIGFLIGARYKISGESGSFTDDCNTIDVTALAGLSYTFAENFVVSARYGLGLTKISKDDDKIKNSVIQLSVGYKF